MNLVRNFFKYNPLEDINVTIAKLTAVNKLFEQQKEVEFEDFDQLLEMAITFGKTSVPSY